MAVKNACSRRFPDASGSWSYGGLSQRQENAPWARRTAKALPQRYARPAARIEEPHRLPWRVRRRPDQRSYALDDQRWGRVVTSFGYAF